MVNASAVLYPPHKKIIKQTPNIYLGENDPLAQLMLKKAVQIRFHRGHALLLRHFEQSICMFTDHPPIVAFVEKATHVRRSGQPL